MPPRLKSLELHGYKTFASRFLFEFPGIITAVVGPNGSGKSNIADAIRWVLGEQSYSLLRGRKTEDMIFAGSDQRPRAGMASSTITFDNQDGWLPIDFSEVSITRRAYRDGDNEYLLNGQRVRLRDISELLAQSGLAERTYTIIGQGSVDLALSLKPEERRAFFEEAAGIGLYRSRREEALNRLETTRRNLERVLDILSELEPRMLSLEKQAKRVMEYERIRADLRLLLRDWYGYHWHSVQQDIARSREVVKVQEARLEQTRAKLSDVEQHMNVLRTRLQELRSQLNAWHAESAGFHTESEKVSRSLAVLEERRHSLLDQHTQTQGDLARMEDEEGIAQSRLVELTEELERLKADLADAESQMAAAKKAQEARLEERTRVEQILRAARKALVDSETRQVQLRARLDEINHRLENQQQTLANLEAGIESAKAAVGDAQKRLSGISVQRDRLEEETSAIETELQELQQRITNLETERKRIIDQRSRLEADRTRQQAQLDVLEQAEKALSGYNNGAKFVMQSAKTGKLIGKFQPLSSLLDVPAEYEAAISAALGEQLDGILLDTDTDPDAVLELLSQGEKGRAVLIPLAWASLDGPHGKVAAAPKDPDCLGTAADLVKYESSYAPLAQLILGQVYIVRNRSAARRLIRDIPASARVVTLSGEVFLPSGTIIAGQEGRPSVIGRPRQKREIQESLDALDDQLNELDVQFQRKDAELNRLTTQQQELLVKLKAANQRMKQVGQEHQAAALALEQARQKLEWQNGQIASLQTQIKKTEEEILKVQSELKTLGDRIRTDNEAVRLHNQELAGLPLEEFQAQVVHWSTSAAVSSRAVADAVRRLAEHQAVLDNNQRLRTALKERLAELEANLTASDAEKSALHKREQELNVVIDQLQAKILPAEAELEKVEADYNDWQATLTATQQAVAVAERYASQAQLELTRQRETLDSLRRRIEDDYGQVVLEYTAPVEGQSMLPMDGVEQLPLVTELPSDLEETINRQRSLLRRMGAVNPEAQKEYEDVRERYGFLTSQVEDLKQADADLRKVIAELDDLMRVEFRKTFDLVAEEFHQMFTRLFGGGSAHLVLSDEEHPTEAGIDIEARLPGRREQGLALLSGGERSLTAVALIFSLLKVSPTPFCVLDEVDAALDEANVGRFCDLLRELSKNTQFIIITHNRNTVQAADVIYGVTMGRDSTSQVISMRLDELSEEMVR